MVLHFRGKKYGLGKYEKRFLGDMPESVIARVEREQICMAVLAEWRAYVGSETG